MSCRNRQKNTNALPWWKQIVLDNEYRLRIMKLATERYRTEMSLLRDYPEKLAPALWDDETPIFLSPQYILLEDKYSNWATKHPEGIIKASSFATLRAAAATAVISTNTKEEKDACILEETKKLYNSENKEKQLYGLSYIWNRPLPPAGFIRLWPDAKSAMWPSLPGTEPPGPITSLPAVAGTKVEVPRDMSQECLKNPLCVHVFRKNGVYLGAWRQSQMLIRYKVICWALHEEERRQKCSFTGCSAPTTATVTPNVISSRRKLLKNVPQFQPPLLRLQKGTVRFKRRTCRVDVHTLTAPTTWEGIVPAPSMYRAERAYQNWHALHRNSALVYQAVKDVYKLLPKNEEGLLNKETYVEFVLDLLNLFFPTYLSEVNIAIAEEEWVYRCTTELMGFECFFEKFFTFPFIFLRDLSYVTTEQYLEVWSLIRICLLENKYTIFSVFNSEVFSNAESNTTCWTLLGVNCADSNKALSTAAKHPLPHIINYCHPRRPAGVLEATMKSTQKLCASVRRAAPLLINGISGISIDDAIRLGKTDFRNTDGYPLYDAKRRVMRSEVYKLRRFSTSRIIPVVYAKGRQLLKKSNVEAKQNDQHDSTTTRTTCGSDKHNTEDIDSDDMCSLDDNSCSNSIEKMSCSLFSLLELRKKQREGLTEKRGTETNVGRRAALKHMEEARIMEQLLSTSVLYKHRQKQFRKKKAEVLSHISRSYSAWELYKNDVYELQPEKVDEEDKLIAFVQNLPDDFFDDQSLLRVRYGIYAARLRAQAERVRKCSMEKPPEVSGKSSLLPSVFGTSVDGQERCVTASVSCVHNESSCGISSRYNNSNDNSKDNYSIGAGNTLSSLCRLLKPLRLEAAIDADERQKTEKRWSAVMPGAKDESFFFNSAEKSGQSSFSSSSFTYTATGFSGSEISESDHHKKNESKMSLLKERKVGDFVGAKRGLRLRQQFKRRLDLKYMKVFQPKVRRRPISFVVGGKGKMSPSL